MKSNVNTLLEYELQFKSGVAYLIPTKWYFLSKLGGHNSVNSIKKLKANNNSISLRSTLKNMCTNYTNLGILFYSSFKIA